MYRLYSHQDASLCAWINKQCSSNVFSHCLSFAHSLTSITWMICLSSHRHHLWKKNKYGLVHCTCTERRKWVSPMLSINRVCRWSKRRLLDIDLWFGEWSVVWLLVVWLTRLASFLSNVLFHGIEFSESIVNIDVCLIENQFRFWW